MLERVKNLLHMADKSNTAILSFICIDYNMVYSVIRAAENKNIPALVMLLPEHNEKNNIINFSGYYNMAEELANSVKVPIGIHLDHSYDYESVIRGIKGGFKSIMIDGSSKGLEENIALTKKVVETAHLFDVDVEAEIGHVGLAKDSDIDKTAFYTRVDAAKEFCERTGIDSLTIAIGNAHGVYIETPQLDINRLKEINAATDVPLVLHGGSGIPDEQIKCAFLNGINKFNVGTEFLDVYYKAVDEYVMIHKGEKNPLMMLDLPLFVQAEMIKYLERKLMLSKL